MTPKHIIAAVITLSLFNAYAKSNSTLEQGIALYKAKKNIEAKKVLMDVIKDTDNPEASYYLGNVLMNLEEYDAAITQYDNALRNKYAPNNSLFNIACAYSLKGDYISSLLCLIENLWYGDRQFNRIHSDPDLEAFRKSEYYQELINIFSMVSDGTNPRTAEELRSAILSVGNVIDPDSVTFSGFFDFSADGTFNYTEGGGYIGVHNIGSWKIEKNHLILIEHGTIRMKDKPDPKDTPYMNRKDCVWEDKYAVPIIVTIPFEKIFINRTEASANHYCGYYDITKVIYFNYSNKILAGRLGKLIDSKTLRENPIE